MIQIKNVTMKNFMSIGNVTQALKLDDTKLTLVLGENLDLGGGGSRNGVGKSSLVQAISFALFGQPLTNIKLDNLINKTNSKDMVVSIEFIKGKNTYRIERGRRPGIISFHVNDGFYPGLGEDEAHGESRVTQKEINKILGMSREMFKHIVALNTSTEPFLSMGAANQRAIIEELLGVTQLSQKAELLKEKHKNTKDKILAEEITIKAVMDSNTKMQSQIDQLALKSSMWTKSHKTNISKYEKAIEELEHVDIELEIEAHKTLSLYKELEGALKQFAMGKSSEDNVIQRSNKQLESFKKQITSAEEHSCPMCGNEIHDDKHESITKDLQEQIVDIESQRDQATSNLEKINEEVEHIEKGMNDIGKKPTTYYDTLDKAYNHKSSLESMQHRLNVENEAENPYVEQIEQLEGDGLQEVTYDGLNNLTQLKEHQEFLIKLLTDKTSFIRKKIIDQNLSYLNHRLAHYLEKLGLPHEVKFLNDLSVEITELGRVL